MQKQEIGVLLSEGEQDRIRAAADHAGATFEAFIEKLLERALNRTAPSVKASGPVVRFERRA